MMNIGEMRASLRGTAGRSLDFYERRPGRYQLIIPILHEDGDMVDIYLQDSPQGAGTVRICDHGMALMRLSYSHDIKTDSRRRILDGILTNNGVGNDNGNLYLDAGVDMLYEGIMQFAGCVQKVCNMRYWSREVVRSSFYDDLKAHNLDELREFDPQPDICPMDDYQEISVDWQLTCNNSTFYLFGVPNNDKAKGVAIYLLELKKRQLPFISLVVHEDMGELGAKELGYLTRNADKQYPQLEHFRESGIPDIRRLAA